jgi:mono/diheme cytochrome c family protein
MFRQQTWLALGALAIAFPIGSAEVRADAKGAGIAAKARGVLKTYCYHCHGEGGRAEGGFNVVTDLAKLVETKRVVPGKADQSKLMRRLLDGSMPPKEDFEAEDNAKPPARPKTEDIESIRAWIVAGAPIGEGTVPLWRSLLSELDVQKAIVEDLKTLSPRARRFARYFTLSHLANVGQNADQIATYRMGLSKLVNSLSWNRRIVGPMAVGPAGTIVRIDLRDYGWNGEIWESILARYPYGISPESAPAREISAETGCVLPYVRADWFVFEASRPPLYHDVLRLPESDRDLEQQLHIDAASNIEQERVARAGFNESGVSRNNRLIERHESGYGAYWKSYDFAANADRKNLFAHPLKPGDDEYDFDHDGGEIIFSLPNGLQAYMLVDRNGKRIDKGPTTIVRDSKQSDGAVVNGISCMSCHSRGLIDKADQLRAIVERSSPFAKDVSETVLALYPPRNAFEALLQEDAGRFARAVRATGAVLSQTEPVFALARQFEADLDLKLASAEAGVEIDAFRNLLAKAPALRQSLGPLLLGGSVKRDAFVDAFPAIAEALNQTVLDDNRGISPFVEKPSGSAKSSATVPSVETRPLPTGRSKVVAPDLLKDLPQSWTERDREKGFRDVAPPGFLLVGVRVSYIERFGGQKIRSAQPIFRSGRTLFEGQIHGEVIGPVTAAVAKNGYAVGGLRTHTGLTVDGFEIVFMRIKGERLDPNDTYNSPWLGDVKGGGPGEVFTNGSVAVGLQGRAGKEINALGLTVLK